MIISHKHKFIFIKTRKTGGTSIETLLALCCDKDDIITPISEEEERSTKFGVSAQNTLVPLYRYTLKDWARLIVKGKKLRFYGHMAAESVARYVGRDIWNTYYKFCFDRDPWDKSISMYYWKGGDSTYESFERFLGTDGLVTLSNWGLYTKGEKLYVDKVYKYEELAESLMEVAQKLNIQLPMEIRDIRFKSKARIRATLTLNDLNDQERKSISHIHHREITLLGYEYTK
ncbi:MAG: hypothetical protein ACJAUJ_000711 [Salibacteraceae bacterium]|jgi:hypothetical protein